VKFSIFGKFIVILLLLLIPSVVLFTYSNNVSMKVVKKEVEESNFNRLTFFASQVDSMADQVWKQLFAIIKDPETDKLNLVGTKFNGYDAVQVLETIRKKLAVHKSSLYWNTELSVIAPSNGKVVSTSSWSNLSLDYFRTQPSNRWELKRQGNSDYFFSILKQPLLVAPGEAEIIVEAAFTVDSLREMLRSYKQEGEVFLYRDGRVITHDRSRAGWIEGFVRAKPAAGFDSNGYEYITLDGEDYLMTYVRSSALDWWLVELSPIEMIQSPIAKSRSLFYFAAGLLLVLALVAVMLLYRNVQRPILSLVRGVKRLRAGDYSYRIPRKADNEFGYLLNQFNEMSEEMQNLIERVLKESLRAREATVKQLQSQINPHFLYNSFAYIQNMAQMESVDQVVKVTRHLSKFYRYATRVESQSVLLRDEIELVKHYLEVYKMQLYRMDYGIDIDDGLLNSLYVPRFLIQPIVENSMKYGIETRREHGHIEISAEESGDSVRLVIEDSGHDIPEEKLQLIRESLQRPLTVEIGTGLWNIHQRLQFLYGPDCGVELERSSRWGGLKVIVKLGRKEAGSAAPKQPLEVPHV